MSKTTTRIVTALILAALAFSSCSREKTLVSGRFEASDGFLLPYQMSVPAKSLFKKSRPLLIFLHGAGERGSDNSAQLTHGRELMLNSPELQDVIVLAPQCPAESYWVDIVRPTTPEECMWRTFPENAEMTYPLAAVKEMVDSLVASGSVDTRRIYCTGLSMGGMGTLDLLVRFPDLFAAVQPICGAVNIHRLGGYEGTAAVRLFHGDCDETVPVHFSREAYEVLKDKGMNVEYIEYPGVYHNSWDNAFAEPDFLSWMTEKSR